MQNKLTVTSFSDYKNQGCGYWRRSEDFPREGFSLETCWTQGLSTRKNPRSSGVNKCTLWRGNIRHYHRLCIIVTLLAPLSTMTQVPSIVVNIVDCKIVTCVMDTYISLQNVEKPRLTSRNLGFRQ